MLRRLPILAALVIADHALAQSTAPFESRQLSPSYIAEGANVGDFNRDGHLDVVAGGLWWPGPDYQSPHQIYPTQVFSTQSFSAHFCSFVTDVDGDGWQDLVDIGFPGQPAHWFENPGTGAGLWPRHLIANSVGTESPTLTQLVAGGLPELVGANGSELGYFTANPAAPTQPWTFHPILDAGGPLHFLHGLGVGDINGDGRADLLTGLGWLEQPASLAGDPTWSLHQLGLPAITGAQIHAYDVDGDGDRDLISSKNPHGYGLSWFEHVPVAGANPTFVEHEILPTTPTNPGGVQFSQLHAVDLVDIDGDGLRDIVTGKTWLAHNGTDPGANDPAVIYWFRLQRTATGVTFTPHLVHADSGVGRQVVATDLNGDGRADIVTGNKKGVHVFRRRQLWTDRPELSIATGGSQQLQIDVGPRHAGALYWIFGSISGTNPGIRQFGLHLQLNPDPWFTQAAAATNGSVLRNFRGNLDGAGRTLAPAFTLPGGLTLSPLSLHHAAVIFDAQVAPTATTNPTRLDLR